MRLALAALALSISSLGFAQIGAQKITKQVYAHGSIGTTAASAVISTTVERNLKRWTLCHDGGSVNAYLSFSKAADPDTTGARLAAGQCYTCFGCSQKTLIDLNVKGSAAATGYSVIQEK